jgi:hypothetical protein
LRGYGHHRQSPKVVVSTRRVGSAMNVLRQAYVLLKLSEKGENLRLISLLAMSSSSRNQSSLRFCKGVSRGVVGISYIVATRL